jgi:uncharacterized protein (TIGR02246 family)
MWMVAKMQDADALYDVLGRWKAAINAQQPERMSAVFAEDAVFQGLRPYTVGHQGIYDYYSSLPWGMTVAYQVLETRKIADDVVFGYLGAHLVVQDLPTVRLHVGVVVKQGSDGWRIVGYQASQLG